MVSLVILKHGHRKLASDGDRDESFGNGSDDGAGAMTGVLAVIRAGGRKSGW